MYMYDKSLLLAVCIVCGVVFPKDGSGGGHRNMSEFSLTV